MKNTVRILILSIFMLIILSLLTCVNAASASVSASKTNVTVGESVTITVNINAAAWNVSVGGAVSGKAVGYNDEGVNQNASKQFTLNTSVAGTYTVSISGDVTDQSSDYSTPVSGSVTVTVTNPPTNNSGTTTNPSGNGTTSKPNNNGTTTKPNNNTTKPTVTKSSNSKLSSLQIAEGAITPEFSSGTREYQISVPNEVTKLTISATTADSKATRKITGNEELVVGENVIEIVVTAEDGSTTTYKIKAIRAEAELNLQALSVFHLDENGEKVPLTLNPTFEAGIYEYTLADISYKIDNLIVEGIATRENAEVLVTGNEGLKEGENTIQIKVVVKDEAGLEEQKIYTIKVNKEAAPVETPLTTRDKIKNWFAGAGTWVKNNVNKILAVALMISTTTLVGLTIYFAYDYKNYQKLLEELAEFNKANLMQKANSALVAENLGKEVNDEINEEEPKTEKIEESKIGENIEVMEETQEIEEKHKKAGKGKRFKQ